ncbi:hypothetical protein [Clostridium fallax]|uniref:RDD family protein n=1 Tax=Clostridium fallax TaxID=1533 RepID=A0A1M4V9J7_9CLOT|nr:hypothetical protein [Clostridium fallax]SHE65543.1 hypothetical protein SAMN05443638_10716 [Clostridium fallax]SQB05832.1 Uncharacterised protein [Clostridium fallax]
MSLENENQNEKDINIAKDEIIEEIKEENIETELDNYSSKEEIEKIENLDSNLKEDLNNLKEESKCSKKDNFLIRLVASLIDQIIALGISLILLLVFDLILKPFGLYVAERIPVFFFIYVIINILHPVIGRCSKMRGTLGEKITKLNK